MIVVAIVNNSTVMTDDQVKPIVAALQVQVTRDFSPIYGIDASLVQVPKGGKVPAGAWTLDLADNADEPGALGYHQEKAGIPWGIVGLKDDLAVGANPAVTISHELLEMLADPFITSTAMVNTPLGGFRGGIVALLAYEVADAVEADNLGYQINGVTVSDFVLPSWFGAQQPAAWGGKYDFCGHLTSPFRVSSSGTVTGILHGGYIGIMLLRPQGGWTTVNARHIDGSQEMESKLAAILPGEGPHILQVSSDGTAGSMVGFPKYSRRARVLKSMAN